MRIYLWLGFWIIIFLFTAAAVQAQVVISEILPNPGGGLAMAEWVELQNQSQAGINIKGFSIQGKAINQDTVLAPQEILVVARNRAQFTERYLYDGRIIELAISLANDGGVVELKDLNQTTIDTITYPTSPTRDTSWERLPDKSLRKHCYSHSVGQVNDLGCPEIQFLNSANDWVASLEQVGKAEITARLSKIVPNISWQVGDEESTTNEARFNPEPTGQISVEAKIQSFENEVTLTSDGLTLWPEIKFSEIDTTWVELFTPRDIKLDGWTVLLNSTEEIKLNGNQPSNSYPVFNLPNRIGSSTQLELKTPSGLVVDQITIANNPPHWVKLDTWTSDGPTTKGLPNNFAGYKILISEVYPSPTEGEKEWIEIYNFGENDIPSGAIKLADQTRSVLINQVIPAKQHTVLEGTVSLNNSGETLSLLTKDDVLIDKFLYKSSEAGTAWARKWNETNYLPEVFITLKPTPASQNIIFTSLDLPTTPISSAREQELNTEAVIEGYLSTSLNFGGSNTFYIQDDSAGIMIRCDLNQKLEPGAGIKLIGKLKKVSGEVYLLCGDFRITSTVKLKPITSKSEFVVGKLVQLDGKVVKRTSSSFSFEFGTETIKVVGKAQKLEQGRVLGIFTTQDETELIKLISFEPGIKSRIASNQLSELSNEIDLSTRGLTDQKVKIPVTGVLLASLALCAAVVLFINRRRYQFFWDYLQRRQVLQT